MRTEVIGCFAQSLAGRDQGTTYVIIGADAEYVYLVDGRRRTVEAPKKKKRKHVQISAQRDEEIALKCCRQAKIVNEEIKSALKRYQNR